MKFAPSPARRRDNVAAYKWYPAEGDGKKNVYCFEVKFFAMHYAECLEASVNLREALLEAGDRALKIKAKPSSGGCGYLANAGVYFCKNTYEVYI